LKWINFGNEEILTRLIIDKPAQTPGPGLGFHMGPFT